MHRACGWAARALPHRGAPNTHPCCQCILLPMSLRAAFRSTPMLGIKGGVHIRVAKPCLEIHTCVFRPPQMPCKCTRRLQVNAPFKMQMYVANLYFFMG